MKDSFREAQRRRPVRDGMLSFRSRQVPVRALVPNLFTLLGLCAGLTAIRMAIEARYEYALALIVAAAIIDGLDGRIARLLKAQSRFGAELDSLADFVNFGVAPAVVIFTWGLGSLRSFGWIVVMVFAVACGLRLARFNAALEVEKPRWQSNYFTGIPAPAGAITVLLPLYINGLGFFDIRAFPLVVVLNTLLIAVLMVSTIPTFSGKLAGERISREYVPIIFMMVAVFVALLLTYPYWTLAVCSIGYLCMIPFSLKRYRWHKGQETSDVPADAGTEAKPQDTSGTGQPRTPSNLPTEPSGKDETRH